MLQREAGVGIPGAGQQLGSDDGSQRRAALPGGRGPAPSSSISELRLALPRWDLMPESIDSTLSSSSSEASPSTVSASRSGSFLTGAGQVGEDQRVQLAGRLPRASVRRPRRPDRGRLSNTLRSPPLRRAAPGRQICAPAVRPPTTPAATSWRSASPETRVAGGTPASAPRRSPRSGSSPPPKESVAHAAPSPTRSSARSTSSQCPPARSSEPSTSATGRYASLSSAQSATAPRPPRRCRGSPRRTVHQLRTDMDSGDY